MIVSAFIIAASSYMSLYLERNELAMVYPFDDTYVSPQEGGEPRLRETPFLAIDGEKIITWQFKAAPGQPTLLYFPGNAGGLKDRSQRFSRLIDRGVGVIAVAYRGSSGSGGKPSELALTADALEIANSVKARPLVLYGESLGTGVAVKLAAQGIGDALVLEAPFTSISDIVEVQFPLDELGDLLTQKWITTDHISQVMQPMLIIHGENDKVIPIEFGRQLFEQAGSAKKLFYEVPGKGHHGLWTVEMQKQLFAFLSQH